MLLAAGQPMKVISEILGHATSAFTADVYTEVADELADAAAAAIAAYIPRRGGPGCRLTVLRDTGTAHYMTTEKAGQMLSEWVIVTRDRDARVRAAVAAGSRSARM
jgi:hypothetical protein